MDIFFNHLVEETQGSNKKIRILFRETFNFINNLINKNMAEKESLINVTTNISISKKREDLKRNAYD